MIAQQPIDRLPRLTDPGLAGAWCNLRTKGGTDYGPSGYDMSRVGSPSDERVGVGLDGAADYLRRGVANWRIADSRGSVSAWIKRSVIGAAHTVIASCDEVASTRWWILSVSSGNKLAFSHRVPNSQVLGSTNIVADRWYHVVVTCDGSLWRLYVDSSEETLTVPLGTNNGAWLAALTNRDNVTIGLTHRNVLENYFNGQIKDVRYSSTVYTADEIADIYRLGVPDNSLALLLQDGVEDYSRFAHALTYAGGIAYGHRMYFDGVDDSIDCGDIGDILTVSMWINPETTTEQIFLIDAGKYVHVVGGTVTYVGVTPTATYVNGVATTTLAADRWQHLVCVLESVDANNFELGHDGAGNYGDVILSDVRAFSEAKSADWVAQHYDRMRIFY